MNDGYTAWREDLADWIDPPSPEVIRMCEIIAPKMTYYFDSECPIARRWRR
jgi:hypothetical protein